MASNIVNQVPYLRTSREFPTDPHTLTVEIDKAYLDIAGAVNNRTIGIYTTGNPSITGEQWFLNNTRFQTLRQVYTFGSIATNTELDIPVIVTNFVQYTKIYGTVITTNGSSGQPDYRPLPYCAPGPSDSIALLVGVVGGKLQIRIVLGSTAPPVSSGLVVLEWMNKV